MARGERSEDVWLWYTAVYEAIQEIPRGRVTSYGHIARLVGKPECPRQVGVCLKHLPSASSDGSKKSPTFHSGNVPWQRVINAKGGISPRGPGSTGRQAAALRKEGVEVTEDNMGQYAVDFATYGWFPDTLPSEEGLVERSSSSSSSEDEGEDDNNGDVEDAEAAADAAAYHT